MSLATTVLTTCSLDLPVNFPSGPKRGLAEVPEREYMIAAGTIGDQSELKFDQEFYVDAASVWYRLMTKSRSIAWLRLIFWQYSHQMPSSRDNNF